MYDPTMPHDLRAPRTPLRRRVAFALRCTAALACLALSGGAVEAEDGEPTRAAPDGTARLEAVRAKHDVPALGMALVGPEGAEAVVVTGVRARGHGARVRTDDPWHIGSCTKAMTATLLAQVLHGRKQPTWQSTLPQVWPALAKGMHPQWKTATLEHLIRNVSGAPHETPERLWSTLWENEGPVTAQRRLVTRSITRAKPTSKPGTRFEYSNAGFIMAGDAIEQLTGKAYEDVLRKRLFEPLGMTTASFGAPGTAAALDAPRGHEKRGARYVPIPPGPQADNPPASAPAGGVHLSLADWARFIACHLRAGTGPEATRLLPAAAFRHLHAPHELPGEAGGHTDYAGGWITTRRRWADGPVLTHAGSNTLWYAVAWLAPKEGIAFLATCNQAGPRAERACDEAVGVAMSIWKARDRARK